MESSLTCKYDIPLASTHQLDYDYGIIRSVFQPDQKHPIGEIGIGTHWYSEQPVCTQARGVEHHPL